MHLGIVIHLAGASRNSALGSLAETSLEADLFLEAAGQHVFCRGSEAGGCADLRQQVHLEVGSEGVWQSHVAGERAQDEVAHLDAAGRDRIAHLQHQSFFLPGCVQPSIGFPS